jgi:type II secretory pathway component GspD/PulD (secretin)
MRLFLLISLFSLLVFPFTSQAQKKKPRNVVVKYEPEKEKHYKLIPLATLDYDTVNNICRPMLSEGGILTHEKNRNSILVYDTNEVIAKIQKFVREVDREAVNVRIQVDFLGTGSSSRDLIKVERKYPKGTKAGPNTVLVYKNGKLIKPKEVNISVGKNRGTSTRNTSQFIMTKSGCPASLWVGKTMVDPSWLNNVVIRPNIVVMGGGSPIIIPTTDTDFKWANVGASLKVLPHYNDSGIIDVEVYPEVTFLDGKGKHQAVKVQQMVTKVRVRDGQRIYIGGVVSAKKDMYMKLFGPEFFSGRGEMDIVDMYLTATAIKPSGRRLNNINNIRDGRPEMFRKRY